MSGLVRLKIPERSSSTYQTPRVLFEGSIKNVILDKMGIQQMIVTISGVCNSYSVAEWLTAFINMNTDISMTINRRDISTPRNEQRVNTLAECTFNIPLLGWPYFENRRYGENIVSLIILHISELITNILTVSKSNTGMSIEKTIETGVVTIKCYQ